MNSREHEALATIGLLAAQSDGRRDRTERDVLTATFESFGIAGIASVNAHVALGTATLEEEAQALVTPELRTAAWELALGVCHADGSITPGERAFLEQLRVALGMPAEHAAQVDAPVAPHLLPAPMSAIEAAFSAATPATPVLADEAALDETIRQAAVFAAALELLPQGLATLGIVPLQLKLVADIGTAYGHRVDAGHAKELLATVGLGLGGQAIEGFARRLLGRLAGRFGGGMIGGVVDAATGAAATFAATWAIGQVAKSWYASGRALDRADLESRFAGALDDGRAAFERMRGSVEAQARTLSAGGPGRP